MGGANSVIENRYDHSDSTSEVNEDALKDAMDAVRKYQEREKSFEGSVGSALDSGPAKSGT